MKLARGTGEEHRCVGHLLGRRHTPGLVQAERQIEQVRIVVLDVLPEAAVEVCVAWRDRVGADSLGGELSAQPGGIVDQRRLEDAIGAGSKVDFDARDARNDDDGAGIGLLQMRQRRFHRVHGVHHVDGEFLLPGFELRRRRERADIGHDDIEPAELGSHVVDPLAHRRPVADIERTARRAHAGRGECGDRLLHIGLGARTNRDIGALCRELIRDRPADSLRAARHQRLPALQAKIHVFPPGFRRRAWPAACLVRAPRMRNSPALPSPLLRDMVTDRGCQGQRPFAGRGPPQRASVTNVLGCTSSNCAV